MMKTLNTLKQCKNDGGKGCAGAEDEFGRKNLWNPMNELMCTHVQAGKARKMMRCPRIIMRRTLNQAQIECPKP